MIRIGVLCNTAIVNKEGKEVGDPLETALLKLAVKKNILIDECEILEDLNDCMI